MRNTTENGVLAFYRSWRIESVDIWGANPVRIFQNDGFYVIQTMLM